MRDVRAFFGVFLVLSWDGINVIFFYSKIASMPSKRT